MHLAAFAAAEGGLFAEQGLEVKFVRGDLNQALASGDVDVLPMWMDDVLCCRDAGVPVRAIPLDIPVYSTGLVAADRLSSELVWRMREAFAAGYELQRERPELGLAGFRRHFLTFQRSTPAPTGSP